MDERSESNLLGETRAFTGPVRDKGDPHKDRFHACHPSDLFPKGALKEWATPRFSLPSIPNLCVFCLFLFPPVPGCSLGCPLHRARGFTSSSAAGALQASLLLLAQTVQIHIPGGRWSLSPSPPRHRGGTLGISHRTVRPPPCAAPAPCERMLWEELGSRDARPSPPWKTSPCSPGRLGLSLPGCQHLQGKEEEGERGGRGNVEQEGASGCHQPVV